MCQKYISGLDYFVAKKVFVLKKIFVLATVWIFFGTIFSGCSPSGEKKTEVLRVGSDLDFPPFEFKEEGDTNYRGFDIDIARAIAKDLNMEPEFKQIEFDKLINDLESGKIDVIISGYSITDERKTRVNFSSPYYESGLSVIVRADNADIKTGKDLAGKKVAVQAGSTAVDEVKKRGAKEIIELPTFEDCFDELKVGKIDAVVNDRPVNDYFLMKNGLSNLKSLDERLTSEDYGIAVAKNNPELLRKINDSLRKMKDSGEYQKIFDKWFVEIRTRPWARFDRRSGGGSDTQIVNGNR